MCRHSSSSDMVPSSSSSSHSGSIPEESSSPRAGGDELGPSDEVKVFKDEGEDERDGVESLQAELLEEKSSLITESESGKAALAAAAARASFSGRFFDGAFGGPGHYLVSPYAAAYAANGLANGPTVPLSRSPFLYAPDPLSSPPPAHMGAPPGLRPPIYPLAHSQYPYSMLGADQLAAWHHQAASSMYQANAVAAAAALRSASPYGLPITSGALTSPMSRFSPTGLLHPGLSPGGGLGGGTAVGGPIKAERPSESSTSSSSSSNHTPRNHHIIHHSEKSSPSKSTSAAKKSKEPHIKKPLNAFMLYMKEMRPVVQSECTLKESAAINQILGRRWHGLSREEQAKYYEKARMERQKHMQMYPHWNARDNYRFGQKKKKRKRDRSDDPAGGMKKCRARYGLDQQELWCKPCRRKKKCIRVQAYLDGKNGSSGAGDLPGVPMGIHHNNNTLSQHPNHRPEADKDESNMFHSDGEEDEDEEEDSEETRSHPGSLESPSEPSLTSPAGFSSLPSLGSPASIASPLTPSGLDSDWLRFSNAPSGAFKPPTFTTTSTSSSSSSSGSSHFAASMHHHLAAVAAVAAGNMAQRPPVGNDPRDAKNPLSISQLTGNNHPPHHPALLHGEHNPFLPPQTQRQQLQTLPSGGHHHPPPPPHHHHHHHTSLLPPPSHPDKRPPLLSMT